MTTYADSTAAAQAVSQAADNLIQQLLPGFNAGLAHWLGQLLSGALASTPLIALTYTAPIAVWLLAKVPALSKPLTAWWAAHSGWFIPITTLAWSWVTHASPVLAGMAVLLHKATHEAVAAAKPNLPPKAVIQGGAAAIVMAALLFLPTGVKAAPGYVAPTPSVSLLSPQRFSLSISPLTDRFDVKPGIFNDNRAYASAWLAYHWNPLIHLCPRVDIPYQKGQPTQAELALVIVLKN